MHHILILGGHHQPGQEELARREDMESPLAQLDRPRETQMNTLPFRKSKDSTV
jgi:hypothetical protein